MANDGARLAEAAFAAAQRGEYPDAVTGFERAAQAHLAARDTGGAFAALSNLAMVRKLLGDLRGAVAAIDQALALPSEPQPRMIALMTRASILDALDDREAITAWQAAAEQAADPAAESFARAHAAGALLKHGHPAALTTARAVILLANAGTGATPSQLIGIVGAIGESAGAAGVPMLAQAVLLLQRHMDAFDPSTAPFWDLLVDRVGPGTPFAIALCSFGLIVASLKRGQPEFPVLMSRIGAVLDRIAHAHRISVEDVLAAIERRPELFQVVDPTLRGLIPADSWVIAP